MEVSLRVTLNSFPLTTEIVVGTKAACVSFAEFFGYVYMYGGFDLSTPIPYPYVSQREQYRFSVAAAYAAAQAGVAWSPAPAIDIFAASGCPRLVCDFRPLAARNQFSVLYAPRHLETGGYRLALFSSAELTSGYVDQGVVDALDDFDAVFNFVSLGGV